MDSIVTPGAAIPDRLKFENIAQAPEKKGGVGTTIALVCVILSLAILAFVGWQLMSAWNVIQSV